MVGDEYHTTRAAIDQSAFQAKEPITVIDIHLSVKCRDNRDPANGAGERCIKVGRQQMRLNDVDLVLPDETYDASEISEIGRALQRNDLERNPVLTEALREPPLFGEDGERLEARWVEATSQLATDRLSAAGPNSLDYV
jgi:hypothetical protein